MVDPNDFVTKDKPEGEERDNSKAGQQGAGRLPTKEAKEAYSAAAKEHFRQDIQAEKGKKKGESLQRKKKSTLPQIGSIADDEISID